MLIIFSRVSNCCLFFVFVFSLSTYSSMVTGTLISGVAFECTSWHIITFYKKAKKKPSMLHIESNSAVAEQVKDHQCQPSVMIIVAYLVVVNSKPAISIISLFCARCAGNLPFSETAILYYFIISIVYTEPIDQL